MKSAINKSSRYSRRGFLGKTIAATAAVSALGTLARRAAAESAATNGSTPQAFKQKIKLGVLGLGGRGHWIAGLFQEHGGYQIYAVADYFSEVADKQGEALGVDRSRRFAGLSGFKRLIESGIEAVVIIDVPYFYPEQAEAAVAAGLHVYMAKPVAVDVPGALTIGDCGRRATAKHRVFMVDYQIPTDPANMEVIRRVHDGALGKLATIRTFGISSGWADLPKTATIESRLRDLVWLNDTALGCGYIGNYDIHAIDVALWAIGQRPVSATGASRICRKDPHGDSHDVSSVLYEYAGGLVHNHVGQELNNQTSGELSCHVYGTQGNAFITYWGKAELKTFDDHFVREVANLYDAGAKRNIATFYQNITEGQCSNMTVPRAVDGVLTCVLGREAAVRRTTLTMDKLLKENQKLEVNLTGLKV